MVEKNSFVLFEEKWFPTTRVLHAATSDGVKVNAKQNQKNRPSFQCKCHDLCYANAARSLSRLAFLAGQWSIPHGQVGQGVDEGAPDRDLVMASPIPRPDPQWSSDQEKDG